MDDELGQGRIEGVCFERKILGSRVDDSDAGMTRSSGRDERFGRIDGGHAIGSESGDELGRERTGPASDVEDALTWLHAGQVGKLWGQLPGVAPHEAELCLGGDVEAHHRESRPSADHRFALARFAGGSDSVFAQGARQPA